MVYLDFTGQDHGRDAVQAASKRSVGLRKPDGLQQSGLVLEGGERHGLEVRIKLIN